MRFYIDNPKSHVHTGGVVDPTTGDVLVKPGHTCFIFTWDDGRPVFGRDSVRPGGTSTMPDARKYCTTEANRISIMAKLASLEESAKKAATQAKAGATKPEVQASASASEKKEGNVAEHVMNCKDGTIVIMKNCNIIFLPANKGQPHGILLEGKTDKDFQFVYALLGCIYAMGKDGSSMSKTGKELLEMDPYNSREDTSAGLRYRPLE